MLDQRGGRFSAEHFLEPAVQLMTGSLIDNHDRLLHRLIATEGSATRPLPKATNNTRLERVFGGKATVLRGWHTRVVRRFRVGLPLSAALAILTVLLTQSPAFAAVAITVPSSKNLGSVATGTSTLSAQLGTVTVTASGLIAPNFVATVTATVFITGAGSANQTIGKASIFYWSGPATSFTGLLAGGTPGQANAAAAVDLSVPRTAFSGQGTLLTISGAWNPTIVVHIPAAAVAGTYTGTITHSVA